MSRPGRVLLSTGFLGVLIGLASWRVREVVPGPGLDASWTVGLRMAADRGLDFGHDILFTYGPLGFLDYPLILYSDLAAAALVYELAVQVALGVTLLYAARQSFPLAPAFLVALVVACLVADPASGDPVIAIGFLLCAIAVAQGQDSRLWRALPIVVGVAAGLLLLVRLNSGVLVAACGLVAVAVPAGARLSRTAAYAGSLAVTLLALWLLSGQSLTALDDFARGSGELMSGYPVAMAVQGIAHETWYLLLGAILIAAGVTSAVLAGRDLERSRRIALVLLVLVLFAVASKGAFVREEPARSVYLATAGFVAVLAFRWVGRERIAALGALAAIAVGFLVVSNVRPGDAFNIPDRVSAAVDELRYAVDGERRERALVEAAFLVQGYYGVDARTRELLEGEDVHVYPSDAALAWAYGLDWDPLPVFQSYTAYTTYLDELNAAELASPDGPVRILVHGQIHPGDLAGASIGEVPRRLLEARYAQSIDGRYLPWDQPASTLAMLCNFRAIRTTRLFQVLARVPDRCGAARPLGSRTVPDGTAVEVPRPSRRSELVFARVEGLEPAGLERVRTLAYRAVFRRVSFDGEESFRLVPGVADDGLVLRVPRAADFPSPFSVSPQAGEVAFGTDDGFLASRRDLRIEFFAMPIRAPGAERRSAGVGERP